MIMRADSWRRRVFIIVVLLAFIQALTHFGIVYSDNKAYFSLIRCIEGVWAEAST